MNTLLTISGLVLGTMLSTAVAASGKPDTDVDKVTKAKPSSSQQHQHRRGPKRLALTGADGAKITLWRPDLKSISLQEKHLMHGTITIPPSGLDNYHAIVAEKDWGNSKEAVIRYEYLRGKPSKKSPTILSNAVKTDFEIVPDPIPRGHYHYFTGQRWNFITRFKDRSVPNVPVVFETDNGSRVETTSDANGKFSLDIPTDFPNITPGERDKRKSDFSISAEYSNSGITYTSTLSAEYRINRINWRSVELGILVAGIGAVGGGLLGRRIKGKKS